jgi:hypothetical protein
MNTCHRNAGSLGAPSGRPFIQSGRRGRISVIGSILNKPCLIEPIEGSFVIEPLQFISAAKVYAKGRRTGFGVKIKGRVRSHVAGDMA